MAIYSCNLKSIGRSTHAAGTAGAHILYISRRDAQPTIIVQDMPHEPMAARNWLDRAERASRKNARVIDKIRLALPRELNDAQRAQLIRDFMADLTGGRSVPWFAAIHQTGKDAHNPHAHIAVHDRELGTNKRVLRLSDSARDRQKAGLPGPKAVQWIRERWEAVGNRALAKAGHEARIDRRTLEAQGIDRAPTIHEGPRAQHINDNVKRPASKPVVNGAGRTIDYPAIDRGRTRREFNAHIIDLNLSNAIRLGHPETAAWAKFEKEQVAKDRDLEKHLRSEQRARTKQVRMVSGKHVAERNRERAEHRLKTRQETARLRDKFERQRDTLRSRHDTERRTLRKKHRSLMARIARRLSRNVRARHRAERVRQIEAHREERRLVSAAYQQAKLLSSQTLDERYSARFDAIEQRRSAALDRMQEDHRHAEKTADDLRQQREAEREQARALTERKIQDWKKLTKDDKRKSPRRTSDEFKQAAKGDAISRAVAKVKQKEEERERRGRGQGRERGR